jgi:DNA-binding PadR family transcriptional regulator
VNHVRYPLKYAAFEWLKEKKSSTDDDLLDALNKNGGKCSPDELDKVLMQLEILGLITIRWVSKDKRRVEVTEKPTEEPRMPRISE